MVHPGPTLQKAQLSFRLFGQKYHGLSFKRINFQKASIFPFNGIDMDSGEIAQIKHRGVVIELNGHFGNDSRY